MARYLRSPGPKYCLPSGTGFDGHDPTLPRAPAVSIATGRRDTSKTDAPGPKYQCSRLYRVGGELRTREAYLEGKPKYLYNRYPSAQSYGAQECPDTVHVRPPSWVLLGRSVSDHRKAAPAPKYRLKDLVGTNAPEMSSAPQYSILGRGALKLPKSSSPGPGRYANVSLDLYLPKAPGCQITSKPLPSTKSSRTSPAPKYNSAFKEKKCAPAYSFGVRHSPYEGTLFTPADRQPFYGF